MDQKKNDDKKPAIPIPTLRDSKNAPQLKIKGLAQGGLSLMERLKQFKKKDLAFILAGLGVLFLAPLAEHFMMAPEGDTGGMQGGFGKNGGEGMFGKGTSPYETGYNGLAPGGAVGAGSDVITPLNVRDPSALVMGPGATQQPPATSAPAPAAPSKPESNDWKDALAQSAAKAGGAAAKAAALPVPKVPLSAGGLRGLGAVSGGGGGSYSLPAISANGVPNKAAMSNSPSPTGGGGIRGVGARGEGQGGNPNNLDALKKAAQNAANVFNGPGSAASNLEQAAKTSFGDGSGGGAGEGGGAADKASGQSGDKGSKNADGQSLAFLKAKQEQEKAIEFEWKKKEAADTDLLWYKIRDKMAEEMVMTPLKALTGDIAKKISKFGTNASGTYQCFQVDASNKPVVDANGIPLNAQQITDDQVGTCGSSKSKDDQEAGSKDAQYYSFGEFKGTGVLYLGDQNCGTQATRFMCSGGGSPDKPKSPPDNSSVTGTGAPFAANCDSAANLKSDDAAVNAPLQTAATNLGSAAASLVQSRDALSTSNVNSGQCKATQLDANLKGGSIGNSQAWTQTKITGAIAQLGGATVDGSGKPTGATAVSPISDMVTAMNAEISGDSGNSKKLYGALTNTANADKTLTTDTDSGGLIAKIGTAVSAVRFDPAGPNGIVTQATQALNDAKAELVVQKTDLDKVNNMLNTTIPAQLGNADNAIKQVQAAQGPNNSWDKGLLDWRQKMGGAAGTPAGDLKTQQDAYTAALKTYNTQLTVVNDALNGYVPRVTQSINLAQKVNGTAAVDAGGIPSQGDLRGFPNLTQDSSSLPKTTKYSDSAIKTSQFVKDLGGTDASGAAQTGSVSNAVSLLGRVVAKDNSDATKYQGYLTPTTAPADPSQAVTPNWQADPAMQATTPTH